MGVVTTEEFIRRARLTHGDRYLYDRTEYRGANIKVVITCPTHGDFLQIPREHAPRGSGCQKCGQARSRPRVGRDEFIRRAREVHGDTYDYDLVNYEGSSVPVLIGCRLHGVFAQSPENHAGSQRQGCPTCGIARATTRRRKTQQQFEDEARATHGDRYDYSLSEYRSVKQKIRIICREHGPFDQLPHDHLRGRGCSVCAGVRPRDTLRFVAEARAVHGDRYGYSNVQYTNANAKVDIVCPDHGVFTQLAAVHLNGGGCGRCAGTARKSLDEFIAAATAVHGDFYDYSQTNYLTRQKPVAIQCPSHGEFVQRPAHHLRGVGCPACSSSRGERKVREVLEEHGLHFVEQWGHPTLRHRVALRIDFAIPWRRILIEFDGAGHHGPVRFGGMSAEAAQRHFEGVVERDRVKDAWAAENGWRMVRLASVDTVEADLHHAGIIENSSHRVQRRQADSSVH